MSNNLNGFVAGAVVAADLSAPLARLPFRGSQRIIRASFPRNS